MSKQTLEDRIVRLEQIANSDAEVCRNVIKHHHEVSMERLEDMRYVPQASRQYERLECTIRHSTEVIRNIERHLSVIQSKSTD